MTLSIFSETAHHVTAAWHFISPPVVLSLTETPMKSYSPHSLFQVSSNTCQSDATDSTEVCQKSSLFQFAEVSFFKKGLLFFPSVFFPEVPGVQLKEKSKKNLTEFDGSISSLFWGLQYWIMYQVDVSDLKRRCVQEHN